MKIIIEDRQDDEEDEIIIRCRHMDEKILKMIYAVKTGMDKITGINGSDIVQLEPRDIFYFEAVDNKVFVYMEKDVLETKLKLYEIEKRFEGTDFIRVSKSVICNLTKVKSLRATFNGRYEAYMKNGEVVVISRQYVPVLKEKLGL